MSKITKATFKSFIKKNADKLYIKEKSRFDGMVDCVMSTDNPSWVPLTKSTNPCDNNLGYNGIWLVSGSRDYFNAYEKDGFAGIEVYNCCGSYVVGIKR